MRELKISELRAVSGGTKGGNSGRNTPPPANAVIFNTHGSHIFYFVDNPGVDNDYIFYRKGAHVFFTKV